MAREFTASCLQDSIALFHYYKTMAERAFAQLSDEQLTVALDPEMNSIAQIVKHMAGNMRSRWMGFPEADGEKADRNRDSEFEAPPKTRAAMLAQWEAGWKYVFDALAPLTDADLERATAIRGEIHSVAQALHRQIAHYAYHVGQIVFLAKHLKGAPWQSLSIPRGQSAQFTARVQSGEASQR
ncbi:MAG: DUF1572 family protein [Terriglobales bacterium]